MKRIILGLSVICMAVFTTNVYAQDIAKKVVAKEVSKKGAKIKFNKTVHDYGTIKQKADGTCEFEFINDGTEPLVISNCKGSCGCTVPTWPRKPIQPGEKASIKVKYDTNRLGNINKTVTIMSNAVDAPTKVVSIRGKVITAAPAPASK